MQDATVAPVLDTLARYASAFDEISDETGARYSAAAFVRWLRLEAMPPRAARLPSDSQVDSLARR